MEKYRRVKFTKPTQESAPDEREIRVSASGRTGHYVSYAGKVFKELNHKYVTIKATGQAIPIAITAAEVIKRRIKDLHQNIVLGSNEVTDKYEPLEEGLDDYEQTRRVTYIEITLSIDPLDVNQCGYQEPLPHSEVTEVEDMTVGPKREGRRKSEEDEEEGEEKKPEKKPRTKGSKGKGKGKDAKGKGKEGKGAKGKGKKSGKGKGKGKGKGSKKGGDE